MIAIIDYGMGNLRSVQKAIEKVGAKATITHNVSDLTSAEKIILPGVGAMQPAMDKLNELKLIDAIKKNISQGKPFLGICLGLQLLFEKSDEGGTVKGMGILHGDVKRFQSIKVPHMGWNQLNLKQKNSKLFKGIKEGTNVYFCHSYFVIPSDKSVIATTTDYGNPFVSAIEKDNIFGAQFHPEKSQEIGLKILANFVKL